jgi:putative hydrolase of the HAD superfamily
MSELLAWAAANVHVGLLTNIIPGFVSTMRTQGILPNVPYDAIIDSSEVGAIKPEDKIYQIATERAGVAPEEILLIDDSRPNLMAAEKQGWHVLWFDDYQPEQSIARIKNALELPDDSGGSDRQPSADIPPAPQPAEAKPLPEEPYVPAVATTTQA